MEKTKYYKAVTEFMLPLSYTDLYDDALINYEVGKWTMAKIGRLFVTTNLRQFQGYKDKVFECEVIDPRPIRRRLLLANLDKPEELRDFWRNKHWENPPNNALYRSILDAHACIAVKLVKEITL